MTSNLLRNLIIGLLAINAFYFVWSRVMGKPGYQQPARVVEGVPGIDLLPVKQNDVYQSSSQGQSSCYTFGPFNSQKTAQEIAEKINTFGLATQIVKKRTMQTLNFLVYLPALSSRDEALKVVQDLIQQEVTNYKIIDSGPYKNTIALDSFEDLDKARRHSEYIRFLGYDARYTTQKIPKEVFWINYDEPFGSNAPVLEWSKEIDPRAGPQKIPKACGRTIN